MLHTRFIQLFVLAISLCASIPSFVVAQPSNASVSARAVVNVSSLRAGSDAVIAVVSTIPRGFHAQSNKPLDENAIAFIVNIKAPDGITAGEIAYADPILKDFNGIGQASVYIDTFTTYIPIKISLDAKPGTVEITGKSSYQICDDAGICLAPSSSPFAIQIDIVPADSEVKLIEKDVFKDYVAKAVPPKNIPIILPATQPAMVQPAGALPTTMPGSVIDSSQQQSLFGIQFTINTPIVAALAALVAGLIFNIMPCVLPVLPLKAWGFFEAAEHDRAKTIGFGAAFASGMVSLFIAIGLLIFAGKALFGLQIQWGQWFAYPAFVWGVMIVVSGLGLGLLGVFSVNLPTGAYSVAFRHDTYTGNFMWGIFTAILSTPCTAPFFPPVMAWALTQSASMGVLLMALVGIGMATPYLLLSAFPEMARRFPRTGPFAEVFKQAMGFLMLATAAWFLGLGLRMGDNQWWLVLAVMGWGSIFVIVRTTQVSKSSSALLVSSAIAVAAFALTTYLTLDLTGTLDRKISTGQTEHELWQPFSDESLFTARKEGRIVLVKFTADWCLNCKYIERTVYTDPKAIDELMQRKVVMLKADLTLDSAPGWKLRRELGGSGIPFTAIYSPNQPDPTTLASVYSTADLVNILKSVQ